MNKKARRHNGWTYPDSILKCSKQYIINNCLEPQPYWDDWSERRDGMRDRISDRKKIKKIEPDCYDYDKRQKWNRKQKKLLKIRLARKHRKV